MIFRVIILSLVVCLCLAEKPNVDRISSSDRREIINLAVVACGDRAKETLVLLKSALMFTRSYLHFIIITEKTLKHSSGAKFSERERKRMEEPF